MTPSQRLQHWLTFLYGADTAAVIWPEIEQRIHAFQARHPQDIHSPRPLDHTDAILITYGDQFQEPGRPPLQTLRDFLDTHLGEAISGVHILPFFPYSSDDGFSVIDYTQVAPQLGDWHDIEALGEHYRLMFDAVINHVSRESAWFQGFLRDEAPYRDYFITVEPDTDLSSVVRPRALPLLTAVETASGRKYVWTTFSADQIDLNYANPHVLLEIIDILLLYVEHGADLIRLDAIAYLWKEIGTSCIHLPQTHAVVKLWRALFDIVAPGVRIITETNVPHEENISYWGTYVPETGLTDEAQLVYNFPLAPLVLHTFSRGDAGKLTQWAASLQTPPGATFFNFIASHDGIGVMPARGILSEGEVDALVGQTLAHGGQVGYKANADGSRSVYELNITLYDFLNNPRRPQLELDVKRFLASQAVLLSLAGVPGIYVHSLFGSHNCQHCFEETGRARSLNREKFLLSEVEQALGDEGTHQHHVFARYRQFLQVRRQHPAFHPDADQTILSLAPTIFAVLRQAPSAQRDTVLCLVNVTGTMQQIELSSLPASFSPPSAWHDLFSGRHYSPARVIMMAYEVLWLVPC
ncbi:MAG: sugar phosphorylase [Chloroflexi bacterium]|nr:sugar phosphorylase [Chloroflexota bacterium]